MYLMQTVSNGRRPGDRVMDRRVVNSTLAPLDGSPGQLDHHGKTDPYLYGKIEPYHGKMESYQGKMQPYHGHMEPYHGHVASEHARPALVTRTHGPADQEPVYQNQGNFFQLVTPQKFTARPLASAPHGGSAFAYKSVQSPNYRVKPVETTPFKAVETPHYKVKAVETPFYKAKSNDVPQAVEVSPNAADSSAPAKEEKKRKWTLGGLFRRRKKAAGESESSSGDDEPKLGFLARRRSRREKRKARARGFDVVRTDAAVMSADSLQATPPTAVRASASLGGSHDRLRDSSLSLHSSGGSGSLEGLSRRERRSVIMQRAEALRQHGSSSDEGVDGGSLHRVGSTSRRSRYARTERYIKRLSRDEESVLAREAFDKQRAGWDSEHASTTSPGASPQIRPRHLATASAPTSSPASLERRHHGANLRPLNVAKAQRGHSPLPPSHGPTAPYQPLYANYAPRSLSYDNNIHLNTVTAPRHDAEVHVTCLNTPPEDKVMVVQFPVGRLSQFQPRVPQAAPRSAPPPPPRRYTPIDTRPVSFVHNAGSYSSLINASPATATTRVQRPASVTPEDVHPLPGGRHAVVEKKTVFQYFADQNPRSRKPISIQCHAEPAHGPVEPEARYMSDSQMSRVASRRPGSQVTNFWRQKDAEAVQAAVLRGSQESLNKSRRGRLGDSSSSLGSDAERTPMTAKMRYLQDCLPAEGGVKEAVKPVVKMRHSFSNGVDSQAKDPAKNQPPTPPVRRFSRQLSADAVDMVPSGGERKHSTNLEDALDELEAIYKSLKLGDEDLLDRAERRDLPTRFQLRRDDAIDGDVTATSASLPGSMSDSGYDLPRRRGPPSRRSLVPDRVSDDMAYRRLHPKERPTSQSFATGSFLLTSPALSQSSLDGDSKEADAARDDVVYRSVRHVNNALRVAEPQPPFGIPLGPVSPAPHNDYLHSRPSDRYRPTFKPRRTPDVVNDDLAFRALRKDGTKDAVMGAHEVVRRSDDAVIGIHEALHYRKDKEAGNAVSDALHTARLNDTNFSLRKRRAVRSLSANIPSLIGQDKLSLVRHGAVELGDDGFEKAQSLTHLPDALEIAQKMLEGKEVIGGGTGHLWTTTPTPANRNSLAATSTETLTDSRANLTLFQDAVGKRNSWQQKVRVGMPPSGAQDARTLAVEPKAQDEESVDRKSPKKPEGSVDRKSPKKPESSVPEKKDVESKDFTALNWEGIAIELLPNANADPSADTRSVIRMGPLPATLSWDSATSKDEDLDIKTTTSSCADDDELLTALAHDARVTSEQLELQLAGMERRLDEISDDSLETSSNQANGHLDDDDSAPSREEVEAAQEELAQLHIYESDDAQAPVVPAEDFEDVTEEDEEVQGIFQWENSRQFEANNNAVFGTTASTAGKGGAAEATAEAGGDERSACSRRGERQITDAVPLITNMSDPSIVPTPPPSASDSSARVARYKEERRRQLASQFSSLAAPVPSTDTCPSPRRYIARARPDDASIKTTRTSRLRAGVEPAKSPSPRGVAGRGSPRDGSSSSPTSAPRRPAVGRRKTSKDGVSPARSAEGTTGVRKASREESPRVESKRKVSSSGRGSATSDRENSAPSTPKDKTSKRMSSLNIGLAHEPTPPADYEQDASVRRRARRGEAPPSEVAVKEPSAKDATRSSPRKEPVITRRTSSKEIVLTRRASSKEPSPPTEVPPTRRTPSREQILARKTSAKELVVPKATSGRPKEVASPRQLAVKEPSPPKDPSSPRRLVAKEPTPPKDQPSPRKLIAREPTPPKDASSPRRLSVKEPSPPKDPSSPRRLSAKESSPPKDPASSRRLVAKEPSPPKDPVPTKRLVVKEPSPPKEPSSPRRLVAKEASPPKEPSSPRRLVAKELSPFNEPSSPRSPVTKEPITTREPSSPRRLVAKEPSPPKEPSSPRRQVAKEPSPSNEPPRSPVTKEPITTREPSSPRRLVAKEPSPPKEPSSPRRLVAKEPSPSNEPPRSSVTKEPSTIREPSSPRRPVAVEVSVPRETSPRRLVSAEANLPREPVSPRRLVAAEASIPREPSSPVRLAAKEPSPPKESTIPAKSISAIRTNRVSPTKELRTEPAEPLMSKEAKSTTSAERRPQNENNSTLRDVPVAADRVTSPTILLSDGEPSESPRVDHPGPVSILKRKTSRDDAAHHPVTFACPEPELRSHSRHGGILKKHSSLDEAEAARRRSCSPQGVDTKPILKRRSSLEDLVRRATSPESILKRRDEDDDVAATTGILKRKVSGDATSEAEGEGGEPRPILKKTSSEEYATAAESSSSESASTTPRPILKQRGEEPGVRVSKTILKPARKNSGDERQERRDRRDSEGRYVEEGRYLANRDVDADPQPPRRLSPSPPATSSVAAGDDAEEEEPVVVSVADRIRRMESAMKGAVPKRRDNERYKTQPVTRDDFHGLSQSSELAAPISTPSQHRSQEAMSSKSTPSSETTSPRVFESMAEHVRAMAEEAKARRRDRTASRGVQRHRGGVDQEAKERHQTQPITLGELQQAGKINATQGEEVTPHEAPHPLTATLRVASDDNEDAASRLSLAERVRLFDRKAAEAAATPPTVRSPRGARFKTQPVTLGELGRIGIVSPLAAAFVRHPDTDKIAAMPARAAREAMFEHGQSALRSILKPNATAAAAAHDDAVTDTHKSILKSESAGFASPAASSDDDDADPEEGTALTTMLNDVASRGKQNGLGEGGVSLAAELERKLASRRLVEEFNASRKVNGRTSTTTGKEAGEETVARAKIDDGEKRVRSKSENQEEDQVSIKIKKEDGVPDKSLLRIKQDEDVKRKTPLRDAEEQEDAVEEAESDVKTSGTNASKVAGERSKTPVRRPVSGDVARVVGQEEASSSAAETGSDGDSSGGREVKRIIRNEAVARRRQAALAVKHRNGTDGGSIGNAIAKSKSISALGQHPLCGQPSGDEVKPRGGRPGAGAMDLFSAGLKRSQTQPMDVTHDDIKETSSIAERLAALKKSQDTGWQKRLPKLKAEDDLAVVSTNNLLNVSTC